MANIISSGCDVSVWQGWIDWKKAKEDGIKFAILRAGYGRLTSQKDETFERNYAECKANGIPVGVYWYNYATTAADAHAEAKACMEVIKGKQFEFPIAFDIEERASLESGVASAMIDAFCGDLMAAGYYSAIYSFKAALETYISKSVRTKYDVFVAHVGVQQTSYSDAYGIWQYSWTGHKNGIAGDVDLDHAYKDYPSIIKKAGMNGYAKGTPSTPVQPVQPSADTSGANPTIKWTYKVDEQIKALQKVLNNKGMHLAVDGKAGDKTYAAVKNYTIRFCDSGELTMWVQNRLNSMGFDCWLVDGIAGKNTMAGIANFQRKYNLGVGYLGGTDWYYLIR